MNIFSTLFSSLIFILCPLFIYIVFLSTNKRITYQNKNVIFDMILLSVIYVVSIYNDTSSIISFLLLNSLILIGYLRNRVLIASICSISLILIYYNSFNYIMFMIIPYIILYLMNILRNKIKISDFLFIDIFLLVEYLFLIVWILVFNYDIYEHVGFINMILLLIFNYALIHVIYLLYDLGEKIIKANEEYKKIIHDNKVKMSLFKITHEIKNPIAVIKAYLDMLNIKDKKQINKYIPIIKSEIDRLLTLLEDFLLVNKANVSFDLMDINMLIEDIVDKERSLISASNIKLNVDLLDDEIYINGDYNRLSQVLINIIKNSIEAIEDRKGIINISSVINDKYVVIAVEDNGVGISKKKLAKIKEPFYTTKSRGTGLGVSLSDEIIKAHGGMLIYKSREFAGTKVIIKLPLYGKDEI